MAKKKSNSPLYEVLRAARHTYSQDEIVALFAQVDQQRVESLASTLGTYITTNLPAAIERREGLPGYRTNPYVLMTSANVMGLTDPRRFADFLFNNKLYMGLETSFGKAIEAAFVGPYPLHRQADHHWIDPPEKLAEAAALSGLSSQQKAMRRVASVWREVDKSCVVQGRRYMASIKSGPNCINDSQVQATTQAIADNHRTWMDSTRKTYADVKDLDIVIGITYGTDSTTNNKENQILAKLLEKGFVEEDRRRKPGVLIDKRTRRDRVYRYVGKDFWAFIGNAVAPRSTAFVFLEVLLALSKGLADSMAAADLESRINAKLEVLAQALRSLMFPRDSLPQWVRADFSGDQLF